MMITKVAIKIECFGSNMVGIIKSIFLFYHSILAVFKHLSS